MKIVYCADWICRMGGMSVVTLSKANALADIPGNEVYIVVTEHNEGTIARQLSPKVKLIDLGVDYSHFHAAGRLRMLAELHRKRRKHRQSLADTLARINPDIVVSAGQFDLYLLPGVKGNAILVREQHFATHRHKFYSFTGLRKLREELRAQKEVRFISRHYDSIVVLTSGDKETNWEKNDRAVVIPNPITDSPHSAAQCDNKTIVAVGRMEEQKNFTSLIRSFRKVHDKHPDSRLVIYGQGSQRPLLEKLVKDLGLEDFVSMPGVTVNIMDKLARASVYAMSSIYEGIGITLLEAQAAGLPAVAYDCPFGPAEVITHGIDGFLVTSGDENGMARSICHLLEHPEERKEMGRRAHEHSNRYSIDSIRDRWMQLFNELTDRKRG